MSLILRYEIRQNYYQIILINVLLLEKKKKLNTYVYDSFY